MSPQVRYEDLICAVDLIDYSDPGNPSVVYPKGAYNPYNRWNTTDGIMHLTQPANWPVAEIKLGADATVLRTSGRTVRSSRRSGRPDLLCPVRWPQPVQ